MKIDEIIKRDFSTKAFHLDKITEAIHKAMVAVEVGTHKMHKMLHYQFIKN